MLNEQVGPSMRQKMCRLLRVLTDRRTVLWRTRTPRVRDVPCCDRSKISIIPKPKLATLRRTDANPSTARSRKSFTRSHFAKKIYHSIEEELQTDLDQWMGNTITKGPILWKGLLRANALPDVPGNEATGQGENTRYLVFSPEKNSSSG